MARLSVTVPDTIYDELSSMQESTGKPLAVLVREALEMYLKSLGKDVDATVKWGGDRRSTPPGDTEET